MDLNNIEAGDIAETIAKQHELERLGLNSPTSKVKSVSEDSSLGYDLVSIESHENQQQIYIEVKSVGESGEFYISNNEINVLSALGNLGRIYLVSNKLRRVLKVIVCSSDLRQRLLLSPINYRCSGENDVRKYT